MAESDGHGDLGVTAKDRRWNCLIQVAELLYQGKVQLEDLSKDVQEKPDDDDHHAAARTIFKRGKRSPRRSNVNSWLKAAVTITRQTPVGQSSSSSIISPDLCGRNPNFPCKKGKGLERSTPSARQRTVLRLPEPTLPETVKNLILKSGGRLESVGFLIEKTLSPTDVNTHEGRMSMPRQQVRNTFLQSNELELLESNTTGFPARLIQPCLEECLVKFCFWKSNGMYVLKTGWNYVSSHNDFNDKTVVRLWSFRRNSKLCFALIKKID